MSTKTFTKPKVNVMGIILKVLAFLMTFILILAVTLYIMMQIFCRGSQVSRNTFITTVLETGQLKFLASMCLSDEEIAEVVNANSMKQLDDSNVNEGLISVGNNTANIPGSSSDNPDSDKIEVVVIPGLTYTATLMIVHDPSRMSLATITQGNDVWPEKGITLEQFIKNTGAIGAINGGLYESTNNTGGKPLGVAVSNGEIVRNRPYEVGGLVLVGLTEGNILQIIDLKGMNADDCKKMIEEKKIRDAVCFQEATNVDNNHFVQLIINGKNREIKGKGSGLNPRTAIGQRADGALLLLVTDGRGSNGHAGASAADLIEIMSRYGAVNAANIDGGSSTCMYYNGEYLQNSVTFYYSQSSWRLPCAFVIK